MRFRSGTVKRNPLAGYHSPSPGKSQISFGVFGPLANQFPRMKVSDLALLSNDTKESSVALWRVYAEGALSPEFNNV